MFFEEINSGRAHMTFGRFAAYRGGEHGCWQPQKLNAPPRFP
jgi:hypothetical protein